MELLLGQCRAPRCVVCRRLELLRRRPALFPLRRLVNLYAMKTPIARVALNGEDRCCDRRPLLPSALYAHKERGQYVPDALFERIQSRQRLLIRRRSGRACGSLYAHKSRHPRWDECIHRDDAKCTRTYASHRAPPLSCSGLYAHKGRPGFTTPPAALRFGVLPDCRAPEANSPTTSPDSRSSRSAHSETRYNTCLHHPR